MQPNRVVTCLLSIVRISVLLVTAGVIGVALAQDERFPLTPADTTSPRGTLFNLIDNLTAAHGILLAAAEENRATPGLIMSPSVRQQVARTRRHVALAVESLDLTDLAPATRNYVAVESATQLKEVLDRLSLPPRESVPDRDTVAAQGITRWRVPNTVIDIVKVAEGPRIGEFLFDPLTVEQAGAMYRAIVDLPYVNGATKGMYERVSSTPGRLLSPKWLLWVERLPPWSRTFVYGKALWQWVALLLTLVVAVLVPYAAYRWLRRWRRPESGFSAVLPRLIVPAIALLSVWTAQNFLIEYINFTGYSLIVYLKLFLAVKAIVVAYLVYLALLLGAEAIISSPGIDAASLDANLLRMIGRVLGGMLAIGVVFYGANQLGVPVVPMLASLGVGGLAVALAARPTLENLIGGIILYTDRPVRVGDFCAFGQHTGTVERIGVRSTQVRARDRTIITVPNATFADMEIINWASCDMMRILATIGLRYETRPDQLRYVLAKVREMCLAHPRIDNDTMRIRFVGYGESSLDVQVRIYALTRDWNDYFAIQEDVMLRVGEIVEDSGTGIAFPSRTLYLGKDGGLDQQLGDTAQGQVQSWRAAGELPFPNMVSARREQLADTLDYPPRGSPDANKVLRDEPSQVEADTLSSEGADTHADVDAEKLSKDDVDGTDTDRRDRT